MIYSVEVYEREKGITRTDFFLTKDGAENGFKCLCDCENETDHMFDVVVALRDDDDNVLQTRVFEGSHINVCFTKDQFKFIRSELSMLSVAYGCKNGYELEKNEKKEKMCDEIVDDALYNAKNIFYNAL